MWHPPKLEQKTKCKGSENSVNINLLVVVLPFQDSHLPSRMTFYSFSSFVLFIYEEEITQQVN